MQKSYSYNIRYVRDFTTFQLFHDMVSCILRYDKLLIAVIRMLKNEPTIVECNHSI